MDLGLTQSNSPVPGTVRHSSRYWSGGWNFFGTWKYHFKFKSSQKIPICLDTNILFCRIFIILFNMQNACLFSHYTYITIVFSDFNWYVNKLLSQNQCKYQLHCLWVEYFNLITQIIIILSCEMSLFHLAHPSIRITFKVHWW